MIVDQAYFAVHKIISFQTFSTLSILFLGFCENSESQTGQLTLSPMSVAPVCRIGDPLQLTCTASVQFISWSIMVVNNQGRLEEITAFSNSRDMTQQSSPMVVNDTLFTFMRISARNATPLVSTLAINSTSIGLNGTVVRCRDANNPMTSDSASTTIQIFDARNTHSQDTLVPNITKQYSADSVTVMIELTQHVGAEYCNNYIKVLPDPLVPPKVNGSTSCQLTISYNTKYNLCVEVTTPCRPNITVQIALYYVNCGHPDLLLLISSNDSVPPRIENQIDLPLEGSTITFSCPPGLVLTGPNSATCTRNGEWEPDFRNLQCNDSNEISAELSSSIQWITIAYSATIAGFFLTFTIVFFTIVLVCLRRYYRHQKKNSKLNVIKTLRPSVTYKKPEHIYDEIDTQPNLEFGTKKNEAYYSTVK